MRGHRELAPIGAVLLAVVLVLSSLVALRATPDGAGARPAETTLVGPMATHDLRPVPARFTMSGAPAPVTGGEGRVLTTTTDTAAVPNWGLRLNVTDFASNPLPANSAYQVGVEEVIGSFEAVFGLFENPTTAAVPFFSVFTNLTDQNVHLAYWPTLPLIPGDSYDFELVRTNGTNWTLTVNGALFADNSSAGVFDFGIGRATWLASIGFSQVALFPAIPFLPAVVTVPLAMAVLEAGGWYLPHIATASFTGATSAEWGIEGRAQHPTQAPGELETGSQIANVTNGTVLWSGGPILVRVGVSFASSAVVATVPVGVAVIVTSIGGAPLPGVTAYLSDGHQGSFAPASTTTNGTGEGTSLFVTPNVSAAVADPVTARVTLFGFVGQAIASIQLTPATQVFLRVSPSSPVIPPGGQVELAFRAVDASGAMVPGAFMAFAVSGNAAITPAAGVTDGTGTVTVNVSAGPSPARLTLVATVTGIGKWGSAQVIVTVRAGGAHPNLLSLLSPYLLLIAVGAIVGILAFAVARRRRRPPVPTMALKEYARRSGPPIQGETPSPGTTDPTSVSRTRPSEDNP
jgi:hypothetical protein